MTYRRIWVLAFIALLISGILTYTNFFMGSIALPQNSDVRLINSGWNISDGNKVLYEGADFLKIGSLKKQSNVVLMKKLPDTTGESLCFITIGYAVEAFVDGERIYTFGSSLDGDDVWGVKPIFSEFPTA